MCAQGNTPTSKGRRSQDLGNRPLTHLPSGPVPAHPSSVLSRPSAPQKAAPLPTEPHQSRAPAQPPPDMPANPLDASLSPSTGAQSHGASHDIYAASHTASHRASEVAAGTLPSGIGSLTVKLPPPSPAVAGALRQQRPAVAAGAASAPSVSAPAGVSDEGSERSAGSRGIGDAGAVVVAGAPSSSMAGPGISALIAVVEGVPPPVTLDVERRLKVGSASLALCEALKQRSARYASAMFDWLLGQIPTSPPGFITHSQLNHKPSCCL